MEQIGEKRKRKAEDTKGVEEGGGENGAERSKQGTKFAPKQVSVKTF